MFRTIILGILIVVAYGFVRYQTLTPEEQDIAPLTIFWELVAAPITAGVLCLIACFVMEIVEHFRSTEEKGEEPEDSTEGGEEPTIFYDPYAHLGPEGWRALEDLRRSLERQEQNDKISSQLERIEYLLRYGDD